LARFKKTCEKCNNKNAIYAICLCAIEYQQIEELQAQYVTMINEEWSCVTKFIEVQYKNSYSNEKGRNNTANPNGLTAGQT